ncbi:integrase domain-containing protein (plasmid) [Oceanimonas smirnovii]|uniref:integrase domain-containing protein n=1 Tax=Oceanimonas smirnovii TaxID=264574 RepID=UPI003AAD71A9
MSRNYGLGTRDMASAGRIALASSAAQREMSFSTVDTIADRWRKFTQYAKDHGIGRMERVTEGFAIKYGKSLAAEVKDKEKSEAYAQNLVSAVNTVMHLVRPEWKTVSPTQDCKIKSRCTIRTEIPNGTDRAVADRAITALRDAGLTHAAAVAELARELGVRSKEASLLDASRSLREAQVRGVIVISDGTKGGRPRELVITDQRQLTALTRASSLQGRERALIPAGQNWKSYREGQLREGRELLQAHGINGYHDLRSAYACDRYQVLTGQPAPVFGAPITDRELDKQVRMQLAQELGHARIDIISEYIGGRGK